MYIIEAKQKIPQNPPNARTTGFFPKKSGGWYAPGHVLDRDKEGLPDLSTNNRRTGSLTFLPRTTHPKKYLTLLWLFGKKLPIYNDP